jgi:hypothetical protein
MRAAGLGGDTLDQAGNGGVSKKQRRDMLRPDRPHKMDCRVKSGNDGSDPEPTYCSSIG